MKRAAVFLDGATMSVEPQAPRCTGDWIVHAHTAPAQTAERIREAHIVVTNKVPIGAAELASAAKLELIVVAATGYDIIDLDACRARGVAVANSPGYSHSSVPEHAVALMFAVARNIVPLQRAATDGTWSRAKTFCLHTQPVIELKGRTVGIVGAGSLGRATGELCAKLGMQVCYRARRDNKQDELARLPFAQLLAQSDFVSLHCPLNEQTASLFNEEAFARMRPGAILINTARGGLIDSEALIAALRSGRLGGAGIDVLASEPPPADHPLLACDHPALVVTPHVAWASRESQQRLAAMIAATADAFAAGKPANLVA